MVKCLSAARLGAVAKAVYPTPLLRSLRYKEWSGRTPLVTRYILQTLGVLYLLSWATSSLTLGLINIPYSTILKVGSHKPFLPKKDTTRNPAHTLFPFLGPFHQFQLYRLFLAPLVGNSLLSLVFAAIWLTSMGAKVE